MRNPRGVEKPLTMRLHVEEEKEEGGTAGEMEGEQRERKKMAKGCVLDVLVKT